MEGVMQLSMTFANDLQGDMFLDKPKAKEPKARQRSPWFCYSEYCGKGPSSCPTCKLLKDYNIEHAR
jgi:hypothetical protein